MQTAGVWYLTGNYSHFPGIYFVLTKICVNMNLLHKHCAYYIIIDGGNSLNESIGKVYREWWHIKY